MINNKLISVFLVGSVFLSACSNQDKFQTKPEHEKVDLTVAVVGDFPEVNSKPKIKKIQLTDLKRDLREYDAVFIAKKYLQAASKKEYAAVYKKAGVPFFFIGSKKSYEPFVNPTISYADEIETGSKSYITGVYYGKGKEEKSWEYGVHNPRPNQREIENIFKEIYKTINTVDQPVSDGTFSS